MLLVTRLDRLARSTRDLLNTVASNRGEESWVLLPWRWSGGDTCIIRDLCTRTEGKEQSPVTLPRVSPFFAFVPFCRVPLTV